MTQTQTPDYRLDPVAVLRSPFKQKFAIPRQPNLVPEACGELLFGEEFSDMNFFRGLEQFSHLWLLFIFSETRARGYSPTVQPPRLGGRERVGVFASRSPFRPNGLGLSVVRNLGIEETSRGVILRVGGIDMLDGTPVVDIKPYLPYADAIGDAAAGFADQAPDEDREVLFSALARKSLEVYSATYPGLADLITAVLRQDPRPAWRVQEQDDKQYGMTLFDLNIKWRIEARRITVLAIVQESEAR